jgi:SulP family sulfate permease
MRQGYGPADFKADLVAGLTVGIVALPLAMAIAIASGATPDKGLVTAIIAGFFISFLGGSRYQIGGPTAAFIVVVLNVIVQHGYDGMLLATLMAGLMLIAAGFLKLGSYIKYVPYPVITGFTAGIALTIFLGQLEELLGFRLPERPHDLLDRLRLYAAHIHTISLPTLIMGLGTLGLMLLIRRHRPRWPVFLIGVASGALLMWLAQASGHRLPIVTIGERFPGLPHSLPTPQLPAFSLEKVKEVFPSAVTIAFLAGVEALLSAVVADGMTGRRHRSNIELVGQGVANCASSLFGGLPATGAIARTATNIRAGARTPVAGILHATFLLFFMLIAMPLANWIPLACLAAVLVIVAWNISEIERFRHLLQAPSGDRAVLLVTFLLTVFVDLTVAIKVGVLMAALLFMHRMSEMVVVETHKTAPLHDDGEEDEEGSRPGLPLPSARQLPDGVEVYQINGPFFFGAASRITDVLDEMRRPPKILILRMRGVPMMDASGVASLLAVFDKLRRHGGQIILAGVREQPRSILEEMGVRNGENGITFTPDFNRALELAGASTPA